MQLRWTEEAANDLERIADYLFEHAPNRAAEFVRMVYDAPARLLTFPNRGRLGKKEGTRELVLSPLTSYDSLSHLIDAYNETAKKPIDRSLVALRDTIAHGRVLAKDDAWQHFVLTKFTRPDGNGVGVETRYELTFDWMNEQIARVGDTLDLVKARYHELKGST